MVKEKTEDLGLFILRSW